MRKLVQTVAIGAAVIAAFPVAANATSIAGAPGKIAFTSGRPSPDGNVPSPNTGDKGARVYVADWPSGTPVQATTVPAGAEIRHRQPNWSPDHTKIAYAAGLSTGNVYALWIKDLVTGGSFEFVPPAANLDRPSWSPDGTKIAYGAGGDIWVKGVAPGSEAVKVTDDAGNEERPVWSPDGNTIYYTRGTSPNRDLYKISPVAASSEEVLINSGTGDDWQVAVSPDGQQLCFTRGAGGENLQLVGVNGGLATPFAAGINCVWSPAGDEILYTTGTFGTGDLAKKGLNGIAGVVPESWKFPAHFDGNSDWATNFPPTCQSPTLGTGVNQFVSVQLSCTDPDFGFGITPPGPEPIDETFIEILQPPAHGTIGGISDDEKVIYTPNKDFKGTDTFTYTGSDGSSDAKAATVTINVGANGGGGPDKTPPKISGIAISKKTFRRGKKLASISKSPVGTTISFKLSEAAKAKLSFQRKTRVKGKVKFRNAGSTKALAAKAGKNKVKFQGRLSASKSLAPGTYRVVVSATDAAGNTGKKNGPTFTIVTK